MSLNAIEEADLIAVDFDKTLTDPSRNEWSPAYDQDPNAPVIEATREAYKNGVKVVVWTARQWSEASQVAGWLTAHEVPYHGLRCGKGGADGYVDDKSIRPKEFTGEEEVMRVETE
jgi:phosphoserine phosphatase